MESLFLSKGIFRFLMVVVIGIAFSGSLLTDNSSLEGILSIQDDSDVSVTTAETDSFKYTKPVLDYIAQRENIEVDQLQTVNEHKRDYPETGKSYWYVKAIDLKSHQIFDALWDFETESIVSTKEVVEENASRYRQNNGKLEPQLKDSLEMLGVDDTVTVAVWFKSDDFHFLAQDHLREKFPGISPKSIEQPWHLIEDKNLRDTVKDDYLNFLSQYNLSKQAELAQWLNEKGFSTRLHSSAPYLAATLPKQMIYEVSQLQEVDCIYLLENELIPLLDIAVPTTKADIVWNKGYQGSDQRVAVLDFWTIPENHLYINVIGVRNSNTSDDHPSWVASAIASNRQNYLGMAPQSEIVSVGIDNTPGQLDDVDDGILWAYINYDVQIINASITSLTGEQSDDMEWIDRVFDYYARFYRITMVISAGNQRQGNHIGSPAKGYNVLAVGAMDDQRTENGSMIKCGKILLGRIQKPAMEFMEIERNPK